jgi:hypothetical protein
MEESLAPYSVFRRPGGVDVSMDVGSRPMTYNIEFLDLDRAGDSSQPQFREVNQKLDRAGIPAWEMQFSADGLALIRSTDVSVDSAYKITGLGNARKVLNSIAETATDYAAREQLQVVFFSADKPTRQRTYEMLARRMADRMPDHSVYKYSNDKGGQYAVIRNDFRARALKAMGVDGAELISARGVTGKTRGQAMPDAPVSGRGDGMPDRKSLQQRAKDLGLPATGATKEIAQIVGIGEKSPYEWTREEFNEIAPHLSIHQDMRPGSDARAQQIMERGLQSGMVDSVGAWGRNHTWAGGKMTGDNAYLFVSSKLKYRPGNLNPWLDEGNIPIARIKTKPGQTDIYEALIASRPQQ